MADTCKDCGEPIGDAFLTVGSDLYCWRCTLEHLNPTARADYDEAHAETPALQMYEAMKAFGFEPGDFPPMKS